MAEVVLVWVHVGLLLLGVVKLLEVLTSAVLHLLRRAGAGGSACPAPAAGALAVDVPGEDAQGKGREGDGAEGVVRVVFCRVAGDAEHALVEQEGRDCVARIEDAARDAGAGEGGEAALFVMARSVDEMLNACLSGAVEAALRYEDARRDDDGKGEGGEKGERDIRAIVFCEVGEGKWLKKWLGCNKEECADERHSPFCTFGAKGLINLREYCQGRGVHAEG